MPGVGDGTGFDGMPTEAEGLSHYGGDETEKLSGPINDAGTGAHGGSGGEEGSRTTPITVSREKTGAMSRRRQMGG